MTPIGVILPATESQARPLTKLEPVQQVEAWKEVVGAGKPITEALVAKVKPWVVV